MANDGTIKIGVEIDDGGLESEVKAAGKSAGDQGGAGIEEGLDKGSKEGTEKAGANVKSFGDNLKGILAGVSFAAITAGIKELVDTTNEFQEDMGKLSTAAQTNKVSTDAANAAYRDMVGILGETDQSVEAVNHLFALTGDNTQQLSAWTDIAAGVYATFGDSLPLEGLTEAANETARVGAVTGPFADAINWASASADELGATLAGNTAAQQAFYAAVAEGENAEDAYTAALQSCNSEQERAQLITDTLTSLYKDAGTTYQETNSDVIAYRQAQSDLTAALSELGQVFMPVVSDLTSFAATIADNASPVVSEFLTTVQDFGNELSETLQPAVKWFVDNLPTILPVLGGLLTTIGLLTLATNAQAIATGVMTAAQTAQATATSLLSGAQGALNAVMSANPIAIVVALIAGLVVAIMGLWATSEDFRNFVTGMFETIRTTAETVVNKLVEFFTVTIPQGIATLQQWFENMKQKALDVFESARSKASEFTESVRTFFTVTIPSAIASFFVSLGQIPGKVAAFLGDALARAGSFAADFASTAVRAAGNFAANITNGLASLPGQVVSVGSNIVHGIWSGISGAAGWLMRKISGFASSVVSNIKGFFGIHSPSRVMRDQVGKYLAEGIYVGFDENNPIDEINKTMGRGVNRMSITAQAVKDPGPTTNQQTVNFYQPVESPDDVTRAMRIEQRYGLAGDFV